MPRSKAAPAPPFPPFAEEAGVQTLAGLTIENGTRRIALHGALDLTRDRAAIASATTTSI